MTIHYRAEEGACETICPFIPKERRGSAFATRVGSIACTACKHFLKKDSQKKTVVCNQPKSKAVFNKKDKELNR